MTEFTASNGWTLKDGPFGLELHDPAGVNVFQRYSHFAGDDMEALREFFLHERDEQLGRWRWPENPDYVVYEAWDELVVLRESTGDSTTFEKRRIEGVAPDRWNAAAAAWFDAHPEPKPWHDARENEIWAITSNEGSAPSGAWRVGDGEFRPVSTWSARPGAIVVSHIGLRATCITEAHRIWPEATS